MPEQSRVNLLSISNRAILHQVHRGVANKLFEHNFQALIFKAALFISNEYKVLQHEAPHCYVNKAARVAISAFSGILPMKAQS